MDKFKNYISKILPITVTTFFILLVFWVVFLLMNLSFESYFLAFEIVLFFYMVYLVFMAFLNKKEEKLKNQIQELEEANLNLRNDFLAKEKELQEYFLIWIHQIKTPITAGKLICDSDIENENVKNIKKELIYIEDYTNMALSYLKMANHNTDMDISLVNLDDIIKPLIKKYAILFISNNIKLEYEKLNVKVITDSKWCMVVIEQLLSNAIKYTKNGIVSISFNEKENYLEIKDNGIGIKDSDLPKIFDKGYSGFNGRQNQKSTGIGLFLVKQILDKLGQKVKLESKLGEGTSVKVYFNID
ncbi:MULTISPECIES: sensor histidine kinase [Parvimonas]|uniref:sensor histidine kinase n=1 Tax=Parvimonas TaxID=543311 RepID=UPI001CB11F28|nr:MULTISPECIES: sensor histidine kinase [Parvimonas]MBF1294965.1 sensor histidine kinase [Parvimonas sp.]MCK6131120.1 sensor histidine kinase [Parvimonas micra]MCK6136767.1 sensor histidine kinase [Parvimonas micra]MCK6138238.1 sensor histidine kinase [Parvimonas micra]MCK6154767.1 sensor histidine kinase [Parvimonas micra]